MSDRAVLFDLDDTPIDDQGAFRRSVASTARFAADTPAGAAAPDFIVGDLLQVVGTVIPGKAEP